MDEVFRALNDSSRRLLLDRLREHDGQTLGELCEHLPDMSRHGVMKHLQVLEEGGLVVSHRDGRRKLHYLNAVPIRLVHDRWITKYTEAWSGALAALKTGIEEKGTQMTAPAHIYEAYVRCRPEDAWNALTDGDQTVQYFYGTRVESEWVVGAGLRYLSPGGDVVADGEVLAVEPHQRLEMMFHPRWDPELDAAGAVRTVWLLDQVQDMTRVRVEYHGMDPGSPTIVDFIEGIPLIVSGMKTLLETGAPIA